MWCWVTTSSPVRTATIDSCRTRWAQGSSLPSCRPDTANHSRPELMLLTNVTSRSIVLSLTQTHRSITDRQVHTDRQTQVHSSLSDTDTHQIHTHKTRCLIHCQSLHISDGRVGKKNKWFDSNQCHKRVDLIQFGVWSLKPVSSLQIPISTAKKCQRLNLLDFSWLRWEQNSLPTHNYTHKYTHNYTHPSTHNYTHPSTHNYTHRALVESN